MMTEPRTQANHPNPHNEILDLAGVQAITPDLVQAVCHNITTHQPMSALLSAEFGITNTEFNIWLYEGRRELIANDEPITRSGYLARATITAKAQALDQVEANVMLKASTDANLGLRVLERRIPSEWAANRNLDALADQPSLEVYWSEE